jgi:hypothetical protein
MTLERETLGTGGPSKCKDCGQEVALDVYQSAAGWYVGTYCGCGPYSRETDYFANEADARTALSSPDLIARVLRRA